jgi:hypothetical protein
MHFTRVCLQGRMHLFQTQWKHLCPHWKSLSVGGPPLINWGSLCLWQLAQDIKYMRADASHLPFVYYFLVFIFYFSFCILTFLGAVILPYAELHTS